MKQLLKLSFLAFAAIVVMMSCKKQEEQSVFTGGTAPALTAVSTAPMVLLKVNEDNQANTFRWSNPNYNFTTGTSSQDVTYTLQMDTTGSNFTNPAKGEAVISKDLSKVFTVKELNALVLAMGLQENQLHHMEIRLKSTLGGSPSTALYSNVVKIDITPYLDVKYPVPDALYVTGSATPLNWQCACGTDGNGATQKFTKTNAFTFELTIQLSANNSYLFLPQYSSWSHKYAFDGAGNGNNVNGDNFIPDAGGDIKAPGTTRNYKIVVDFKTGKFTVTPA